MNTAAVPLLKVPVIPYGDVASIDDSIAADREERDVHGVYEAIAPHFSSTRYKPWPLIASFLSRVPPNSIGLDSGAGNGKYLPVLQDSSKGSFLIALDRSSGLLEIAQKQGVGEQECLRGDLCFQGWREGVFDFIISIAAIHHLSTHSRRVQSIRSILRPLAYHPQSPFSTFIVYVWAFEQSESSKRKMGSAAVEGIDDGMTPDQDVLVPWVLLQPTAPKERQERPRRAGKGRGGIKQESERATEEVSTLESNKVVQPAPAQAQPQVFHRYYHLFKEGELRQLVLAAAQEEGLGIKDENGDVTGSSGSKWLRIVGEGYERDNWWLEGEVGN